MHCGLPAQAVAFRRSAAASKQGLQLLTPPFRRHAKNRMMDHMPNVRQVNSSPAITPEAPFTSRDVDAT
jgi:hypothetical protein